MMEKKVIFIGGSSYSGSTMLDMMLANSPYGFSAGEVHALFRPFRPHHFHPVCGCGDRTCELWHQVRKKGEGLLYDTLFSHLPEISFIVDSSKDPWWIQRQETILRGKGVKIHNLLIWKEPGAFAHSMLKRRRKGWLKAWKNYYRIYLSLIDDYIAVPYGGLVQNPKQFLMNLCNRLDIPFTNNQQNFWAKRHHTLFGNNSAKIHLQDDIMEPVSLIGLDGKSSQKHRSIYYDTQYKYSLPENITKSISQDVDIQSLVAVLRDQDQNVRTAKLGPFTRLSAKYKNELKQRCGSILGRYWQIF